MGGWVDGEWWVEGVGGVMSPESYIDVGIRKNRTVLNWFYRQ